MQIFKNWGIKKGKFLKFQSKTYKECVRRQDASFEPLAASIGMTGWSVAVRKEKKIQNRRLTANFAHAQPRPFEPIATKFCVWGRVGDVITEAKLYGNRLRGFGVTGPPKRHFL